ncbi:MAG: hypothetical protein ABW042_00225 [Phenylobacterium sp.]
MGTLQTTGWIFQPPPRKAGVEVPLRTEEAEALQRLCPAVRLDLSPHGDWSIAADDLGDVAEIRAFVLRHVTAQIPSDAWRLRSVAYRLLEAEEA